MVSRWTLWRLKQLLIEKNQRMFMMCNYFLNLQIFINNLSSISWKLYNYLWIWSRRLWSLYEMLHVNTCLMTWRIDSQLLQFSPTLILILNAYLKLTHQIMPKRVCSCNMIRMMCYVLLSTFHENWTLLSQIMKSIIRNCLQLYNVLSNDNLNLKNLCF